MRHFPLFIDISDKKILVIGGGTIAFRRITTLLEFGCRIMVVAPKLCDSLNKFVNQGQIDWKSGYWNIHNTSAWTENPMEFDFLSENVFMILGCTDCRDINHDIYMRAKSSGILVNVCDCKEECDFYFPAIIQSGDVTVGLTANGTDHKLARRTADRIRALLCHEDIIQS